MQFFLPSSDSVTGALAADGATWTPLDTQGWRKALARAIRDPDQLISRLRLPDTFREPARRVVRLFPLLVPESYLQRMRPEDPLDPLLRQVLPLGLEDDATSTDLMDPVGDLASRRAPGLLQKYQGRALLITTGACAVHCRYCFRRHYPYSDEPHGITDWEPALRLIAGDDTLSEIILSGGDPLVLTDARLETLIRRIAQVPHVRRLRIHSRLPIVLPERVTDGFIKLLTTAGPAPVLVVHANHANEIAGSCRQALRRLAQSGIVVLNQAVLLRGINDTAQSQTDLSEALCDVGVVPYYLHQLDRVQGAAHFEVSEHIGRRLIADLRRTLPGYLVPRYVREIAGEEFKTPID